jgi:hypothetical protein
MLTIFVLTSLSQPPQQLQDDIVPVYSGCGMSWSGPRPSISSYCRMATPSHRHR